MVKFIDETDIAIVGRQQNAAILKYNKSIIITTDILKWGHKEKPSVEIKDDLESIEMFAKDFMLETKDSNRKPESLVYGESLVDLLQWIITTMMTHKHPPNGPPIPDFFSEANSRTRNMELDILNKHIKTR